MEFKQCSSRKTGEENSTNRKQRKSDNFSRM